MTPEQQFQQMTETANELPGNLQWMAYIALAVGLTFVIMAIRKSYRFYKLDQSEKYNSGRGVLLYVSAFLVLFCGYCLQSWSNIAAMVR